MGAQRIWLIGLIAFAAAIAGVFVGRAIVPSPSHTGAELHTLLHNDLDLDAAQQAQLDVIERDFAAKRKALEAELRLDNTRLAAAIEAEHGYGPRVTAAVDASHRAMGQLQKETLEHIFAMRAILRPEQAKRFDAAVEKALTAERR